jgi:hypothetical protein
MVGCKMDLFLISQSVKRLTGASHLDSMEYQEPIL